MITWHFFHKNTKIFNFRFLALAFIFNYKFKLLLAREMTDPDPNSVLECSFICKPKEGSGPIMIKHFKSALKEDYSECKDAIKIGTNVFVLCCDPKGFLL